MKKRLILGLLISGLSAHAANQESYASYVAAHFQSLCQTTVQKTKNIQLPKLHTPAWAKTACNKTTEALKKTRAGTLNAWHNSVRKAKNIQLPKLHTPAWAKTAHNATTEALQKSHAYALKKWHYLRHEKTFSNVN